jgi:ubiquitin-conjugating enzyme E2 W
MSSRSRILNELKRLKASGFRLPGIQIITTDNIKLLYADFTFPDHALHPQGTRYRLEITIKENYPFSPPVCLFVKAPDDGIDSIPMNPHIYSNGHICLDLLGPAWTPIHTVESLVLSVYSMIVGNEANERPPDDERYVKRAPKDPSKTRFDYHDTQV